MIGHNDKDFISLNSVSIEIPRDGKREKIDKA